MKKISRKNFTILLGNLVDHFDSSIYAFLAPVMAPIFFPNTDPLIGLIMAYSVFATSIITKPIGAYVFSIIAQNESPSYALSNSLIGVGCATFFIGLLPSYDLIGVVAPIMLIILKIIREIFASGEVAIARLYIVESSSKKESFKNSYMYEISTILGMLLASLASTCVYYFDGIQAWRIVFFIGGGAAIVGYLLRRDNNLKLPKKTIKKLNFYQLDGVKILWRYRIKFIIILIVNSFSYITYVIPFITMNHLIPLITNIDQKSMMIGNSMMLIFDMFAIYYIGKIIKKYMFAPSKVMFVSSMVLAITIIPIWYFIENSSFLYVSFVRIWIVLWGIVFLCPLNIWSASQIKSDEKYLVVSIGSAIGTSLIGKMTPAICLSLYYITDSYLSIAFYLSAMFLVVSSAIYFSNKDIVR